jgi:hypothetical protein
MSDDPVTTGLLHQLAVKSWEAVGSVDIEERTFLDDLGLLQGAALVAQVKEDQRSLAAVLLQLVDMCRRHRIDLDTDVEQELAERRAAWLVSDE